MCSLNNGDSNIADALPYLALLGAVIPETKQQSNFAIEIDCEMDFFI